jgi:UDP-2,3-diacylglucosamine hydrolase
VLRSPCYVISDIHLGVAPAEVERALIAFLRYLPGHAKSLLINGDLFDFWYEWKTVIPRSGFRVLAALADLREAGVDVLLVAGNHDCWGGDVLRNDVGIEYRFGPWTGDVGGWRARVEHGDGLRKKEDRRYRMLRALLRHPLAIRAFRWLPADFGSSLASGSSHASRTYRARDGGAGLRTLALEALAGDRDVELIIYGHSHVATLERSPTGGVYANAGSWLDAPTYLVATPERIELRKWEGSAEGDRLDSVDRRPQEALRKP